MNLEHEADAIAREVLISLRTTFITPFDRADVQSLITAMDDSVDQMQQTAKAIVLFEVVTFEDEMRAMADAIVECAELVQRAVSMLPKLASNAAEINEIGLQINRIEGNANEMHDRGLERLYQKAKVWRAGRRGTLQGRRKRRGLARHRQNLRCHCVVAFTRLRLGAAAVARRRVALHAQHAVCRGPQIPGDAARLGGALFDRPRRQRCAEDHGHHCRPALRGRAARLGLPFWVVLSCQAAMALGTLIGGWRIVRTMGSRIAG
jgi:phosphate/sulfate permease